MSYRELQRALVVALHDPAFLDAIQESPRQTLEPWGLTPAEQAQLAGADRRAFATDPLRRRRLLRTLSQELPASTTLALHETRSLAFVEAFFSSPAFHRAVFRDEPLALALGEYLGAAARTGTLTTPHLPHVVELETRRARCRRTRRRPPGAGLGLAPGVDVGRFPGGVLETIQAVEGYLFEVGLMPQVALCDDAPRLAALPDLDEGAPLFLLFSPSGPDVGLVAIDEDLHRLLAALRAPIPRQDRDAVFRKAGVPPSRIASLHESLVDEGVLAEG